MTEDKKREEERVTIRWPREVYEAVKREAEEQERSFNQAVVRIVRDWFAKREEKRS